MIKIENLSFKYENSENFALENINLEIKKGDFVGITGHSGAGKSTLTQIINTIIPHHFTGDFFGNVKTCNIDTIDGDINEIHKLIGCVFEDTDSQFVTTCVEDELLFPLENFGFNRDEISKKLEDVINLLGISNLRKRDLSTLSGGQKQKVAIACALITDCEVLILDEPTAELDPASSIMVFNILKKLNEEFGKTIVIVEQKIALLFEYCKNILILENGKQKIFDSCENVANQYSSLKEMGINIPRYSQISVLLKENGLYNGNIAKDLDTAKLVVNTVLNQLERQV
ncbi:MAG: ABC transporter ATP-binding protein [Oscillospiraceae bacterium]